MASEEQEKENRLRLTNLALLSLASSTWDTLGDSAFAYSGAMGNRILEVMEKEGVLLKIKEDLYFHCKAIEKLKDDLVDFLKKHEEITAPQFKEMTGVSRKYAIPLLEYLDRVQVTVRVGDSRVLRKK